MINRGDLGGMSRQTGISEQFFSSRLGNTVDLVWRGQNPVTSAPDPGPQIPREDVLLLEADLSGTQPGKPWDSGSWVLTLDDRASFSDGPTSPTSPQRMICPTVARIAIGTGGATQLVEVDTRNNSFQLPAANVSIRIGWDDRLPPILGATAGAGYFLPDSVRVWGQLQRGFSSSSGKRTILLPYWVNTNDSPRYAVPPFARCARVWGQRGSAFFTSGALDFLGETPAQPYQFSDPLIIYPGPRLENPAGVPVPARAQSFRIRPQGVPPGGTIWGVEFDVSL
jgi:hypothetical protein